MNETTNDQNPAELSPLDGPRGVGDLLRSDPARVARYAEALRNTDNATLEETNFGQLSATYDDAARAVMVVADEERAALVAELERLRGERDEARRNAEHWRTEANNMLDDAHAGSDALLEMCDRVDAAEAKVAKVEALAEEWWNEAEYDERASADVSRAMHSMVGALRAAVSSDVCPHGRYWSGLDDHGCAQCRDLNLAVAQASPPEPTDQSCPYCDGRGIVDNADHRCGWCGGSGRLSAVLADAPAKCPECGGSGMLSTKHFDEQPAETHICDYCNGSGAALADAPAEQRAEGGA